MSNYGAEQPWTPFLGGTLAGPPGEQEMTAAVSPPARCRRLTEVPVAVVGGGLAGLYVAWLLQQQGLAVTLFEASNHLGGRVLSSRDFIPGKVVEAGAELIGMNHPTWQALAKRFGLTLTKITGDPDGRIRFGHHELSAKQLADLAVDRRAVQYAIGQDALVVNQVEPWLSPRAAALDATTLAVHAATGEARQRALEGRGPTFIEARTYRYEGHNVGDVQNYREKSEVTSWRESRDPIDRLWRLLAERGDLDEAGYAALQQQAADSVADAIDFAEQSPWPDTSTVNQSWPAAQTIGASR
jgi:hypothetical protein